MSRSRLLYFTLILIAAFVAASNFVLAVTIGPAKMEYRVDPGAVLESNITLINDTDAGQTLYPAFEKFIEVNGEKRFLPAEPTELANWIELPKSVALKSREQKQVPFTIEVPKNAPPGGHFTVIWWSTAPPTGSKQVSIVTRAGILVYLQVSGEVNEKGDVVEFSLTGRKFFMFEFPKDFVVDFRNQGNTYLKPRGGISIKNIFGSVITDFQVNSKERIIFPENNQLLDVAKKFDKPPFTAGFYKAELALQWGEKQNDILKSIWFLVFPWKTVLIVVIILAVILFIATKGLKKYNRWIISKHISRDTYHKT